MHQAVYGPFWSMQNQFAMLPFFLDDTDSLVAPECMGTGLPPQDVHKLQLSHKAVCSMFVVWCS